MSNKSDSDRDEPTAVDDVRHVREQIAAQHGGDLRAHLDETSRIFEQMRKKLNLKVVMPPKVNSQPHRAEG
jgi:hypothetical protein